MRIQRPNRYRYARTYAPRPAYSRRRSGCIPVTATVLLGALAGVMVVSWSWLGQRLSGQLRGSIGGDLGGAHAAFAVGDLDTAISAAHQVFARDPDRADALLLLVRALIYRSYTDYDHAEDRDTALEHASDAAFRVQNQPDILTAHALALHAKGKSLDAYHVAQRALQLDPSHALARVALALAYGGVGGFENAMQENQRVLAPAEWQVDALRALAISYSDLGRYQEAGAAVERAINQNGHLLALYFEQALYALQIGDSSTATKAYFEILAIDPQNVKARLRMCELSSLLREAETALEYCTQVTEMAPGWSEGWYKLGREYYLQGDFAAAQQNLHNCTRLQVAQNIPIEERSFECWYLQGQAAEIRGDCPALIATYNEFQRMAGRANLPQTWTYPPEGPPGCL